MPIPPEEMGGGEGGGGGTSPSLDRPLGFRNRAMVPYTAEFGAKSFSEYFQIFVLHDDAERLGRLALEGALLLRKFCPSSTLSLKPSPVRHAARRTSSPDAGSAVWTCRANGVPSSSVCASVVEWLRHAILLLCCYFTTHRDKTISIEPMWERASSTVRLHRPRNKRGRRLRSSGRGGRTYAEHLARSGMTILGMEHRTRDSTD